MRSTRHRSTASGTWAGFLWGRFRHCRNLVQALALVTALEHLHGNGLVHRDIKPSNVIFAGGVPKLADIGLVTSIDATQSFVGTEGFFPPEGPGTPQADIYSLGKLLYETATGKDRREFPELPADLTVEEQAALSELNAIFLKACQHDPHKRLAADLHDIYMLRSLAQDRAPVEIWPDVKIRISRIVDEDDTFAAAYEFLAGYSFCFERDWEQAYAHWNRELLYLPKRDRLWIGATWRRYYGWYDEARPDQEESEIPEPLDIDHRWTLASSRWTERRYAEGAQAARKTLELYHGHAEGYQWLAQCLVANSNYVEGIEATLKAQAGWKQKQDMTALRAYAYARMDQPEKAHEVLRELLDIESSGDYLQPYFVARVYAGLNEKDQALEWLARADREKSEYLLLGDFGGGLRTDPAWDDFQDEPRFWQLCDRLGLGKDQWPRKKPLRD